ncbi:MAG: hypothetical protein ACYCSR_00445, partial [Thiomonas sp.]
QIWPKTPQRETDHDFGKSHPDKTASCSAAHRGGLAYPVPANALLRSRTWHWGVLFIRAETPWRPQGLAVLQAVVQSHGGCSCPSKELPS